MYDLTFLFMYKLALKLGPRVQRQLGQFESKYQRPAGEGNWHLLFHLYSFSTGITHWSPTIVKKVNVFRYRASKEGWRQGRNLAEQSLGLQTPGFFGSPCNQGGCVSTKKVNERSNCENLFKLVKIRWQENISSEHEIGFGHNLPLYTGARWVACMQIWKWERFLLKGTRRKKTFSFGQCPDRGWGELILPVRKCIFL